jgi:hypothetical protein
MLEGVSSKGGNQNDAIFILPLSSLPSSDVVVCEPRCCLFSLPCWVHASGDLAGGVGRVREADVTGKVSCGTLGGGWKVNPVGLNSAAAISSLPDEGKRA